MGFGRGWFSYHPDSMADICVRPNTYGPTCLDSFIVMQLRIGRRGEGNLVIYIYVFNYNSTKFDLLKALYLTGY
ncbi:hypothetical protein SAMN04488502_102204 [Dendrosporobacter quercicolus]|uniref:Uncharacterized protein n=1 Tax=Dendrosporobacter quercicolus TaxID=146817 RepID=A0A1G9QJT8_9FIRM|nr:hypothetical protein SAMN04488502_102204 [Dendrosporobacter quercicolus]